MIALPNFKKRAPGNGADHPATNGNGNGHAQTASELALFEALVARAERAVEQLRSLEATEERAAQLSAMDARVASLTTAVSGVERLASQVTATHDQVSRITASQERAEKQLTGLGLEAERIRGSNTELLNKVKAAFEMREQIDKVLALQPQFAALRSEADALTGQMRELTDNVGRLRSVHDDALRAHKHASGRLDVIGNRSQTMTSKMEQIERRAASAEQALDALLRIASGIPNVQHQLGVLKAIGDQVAQKTAALEQQRETVERAASQVDHVVALGGQLETALRRQDEQSRTLTAIDAKLADVQTQHAAVLSRAEEIASNQRRIEEAEREAARALTDLKAEMQASTERFELENGSLDAVSERIAELRGGVKDCEARITTLGVASRSIGEIDTKARALSTQVATVGEDVQRIAMQAERLRAVRDDVGQLERSLEDMSQRMERVEQVRPTVEVIARDMATFNGAHEAIRDGLEQVRSAYMEMTKLRERQKETDGWLSEADARMKTLQGHVTDLDRMKPGVDALRGAVDQVTASIGAIESRGSMVDELHRRLGELDTMVAGLYERSDGVRERMDAAETRFVDLSRQASDAQRVSATIGSVTTAVESAERRMSAVGGVLEGVESRVQTLQGLGERMRLLGAELEQRQGALDKAAEHLARASSVRREAADAAQHLEELTRSIGGQLSTADARTQSLQQLLHGLDGRVSSLGDVEKRMAHFEGLLGQWEAAQSSASQALEQIASRQAMIDAVQGQITHVVEIAEKTAENVRSIANARREIDETRALLGSTQEQLKSANETMQSLSDRKRQIEELESRLARADALALNVRSTVETIAAQRSVVDQVLQRSGTLAFQMKQAEALTEALRTECALATQLREAVDELRREDGVDRP
jgi:chromosome segregation ATPase